VSLPDGQEVTGAAPGLVDLPGGGQVEITRLQAAPGRVFTLQQRPVREAAAFVRDRLAVQERGQTGIVDFGFTGSAWDDNRRIVNAVIANYQDQNLRRRAAEIDQSIAFISTQLPEVQAALTAATEDLRQFRSLRQTEELSRNTQDTLGRMVQIETRLEEIAFRKEQALQRVTENHPDYRALDFEEEQLRSRLAALREDLSDLPETERELAGLTAQLERARQLEIQLASRVEQLRVLRASAVSNIRVLEWAETALHVGPDRRRPIIFGAVAGLLLAVMGVLGLNVLRRGIEDARTIEAMGLSLFATVEKVPALAGASSADPRYGIALSDSRNTATEALRGLRTGLRFSLAASGSKTLMITSCAPADGKSFVSLNLAMVSGQAGARVLLIDADMRRGILRRYFGLSARTPGLSDLLAGSADLDQVVHRHDASGIDFIPTGAYPPNPAELLAGPVLKRLLDYVDEAYDLVIVDAPPVLAVTDPGIIGQKVGMSLLIVRHLVTTGPELQSVVKTMETAGVAFSGVVLNQFDRRASRYGAYGAKYGYYHGGYQYKYDT
jgi:tyrosine-protein kinase Etk/Wzc